MKLANFLLRHPANRGGRVITHVCFSSFRPPTPPLPPSLPLKNSPSPPFPEDYRNWISDPSHQLSLTQRTQVVSRMQSLYQKYGMEISVHIIPGNDKFKTPETIHHEAKEVFQVLNIGNAKANNGILLYLNVLNRRVEILTGSGLASAFPDILVKHAIESRIIPCIRHHGVGAGVVEALEAFEDVFEQRYRLDPTGKWISSPSKPIDNKFSWADRAGFSLFFLMLLWALNLVYSASQRETQKRTCLRCKHFPMKEMTFEEYADDLTECEQVEASLESSRFQKFQCPECFSESEVFHDYVLTGNQHIRECGKCKCRSQIPSLTQDEDSELDEIRTTCMCCGDSGRRKNSHRHENRFGSRHSARFREDQNDNSSGSGGFGGSHGGGSSSGGGAGGSW